MITWTLDLKPGPQPFNLIVSGCHVCPCASTVGYKTFGPHYTWKKTRESEIIYVFVLYVHLISETWVAKFHRYLTMHWWEFLLLYVGLRGSQRIQTYHFHYVWDMYITDRNKLLYIYNYVFVSIVIELWYLKMDLRILVVFWLLFIILSLILR